MNRAQEFYNHAVAVFGDVAKDPKERTLRFLEEAIELAQAVGVSRLLAEAVLLRVYSRPAGEVPKEIGQCMVTLETLAVAHRVDIEMQADLQLECFKTLSPQHWRKRQEAKKQLGITSDA